MSGKIVILSIMIWAAFACHAFGQSNSGDTILNSENAKEPEADIAPPENAGQEEPKGPETDFQDWMNYRATYGEVKVIGSAERTITIVDENEEPPENVVIYYLADDVGVEGVKGIDEISVGDMVEVEYYLSQDGKRIADFVAVEKKEEELPVNNEEESLYPEEKEE